MINNKVIVIGGNHHNTLGLIRSIGEGGRKVDLILEPCSLAFCFTMYSKYIDKLHVLSSLDNLIDLLLKEYGKEQTKPVLLFGSDFSVSLVDGHYDELKDKFYFFNAGKQNRINHYLDKENMLALAEECGFDTIKTWHVNDKKQIPLEISFPCITKPQNSLTATKEDIQVYWSRKELENGLREGTDYLVQEYIEKEYELNINMLALNHGNTVIFPATIRKIRDSIRRQSAYMILDDIKKYENFPDTIIRRFVKELAYEGICSVELIYKNGKYYFLEINMRNDGCGYLYTASGCNYPMAWVDYCAGNVIKPVSCKIPYTIMQEADFSNVLDGTVDLMTWLKQFLKCDSFFILNKRDPKPFLFTIYVHFRQLFKKIIK